MRPFNLKGICKELEVQCIINQQQRLKCGVSNTASCHLQYTLNNPQIKEDWHRNNGVRLSSVVFTGTLEWEALFITGSIWLSSTTSSHIYLHILQYCGSHFNTEILRTHFGEHQHGSLQPICKMTVKFCIFCTNAYPKFYWSLKKRPTVIEIHLNSVGEDTGVSVQGSTENTWHHIWFELALVDMASLNSK